MLHGVRLAPRADGGVDVHYVNRYVRTNRLANDDAAGDTSQL